MILARIVVGPLEVNCYILADENTGEAVLIDPGADAEDILRVVRDKNLKVRYIINTHAHFDHVGANAKIKQETGAQILMHEADLDMLEGAVDQAAFFGSRILPPPAPDIYVKDGDSVSAGEITLTVLHTPGHSRGGICLLADGMVFTGDSLFAGSIGRTDFDGGDLMTLINSIRTKLLRLPEDTRVFPGHGPDTTIGQELKDNPFLNDQSGFA